MNASEAKTAAVIHRLDCEANTRWTNFTAMVGGAVVGVFDILFSKQANERSAYLMGLFVAEPHRRRGVGRQLLREAVSLCRDRGLASVYLRVGHDNVEARNLYASEGFFPLSYDAGAREHTYVLDLSRMG